MGGKIRFTQASLDAIKPTSGRQYFYDDKVPQLGVTVLPSGKKTFHIRVTDKGRTRRIGIERGTYPAMPIETARDEAKDMLAEHAKGIDLVEARRATRADEDLATLTVEDAVALFCDGKQRRLSTGQKVPLKDSTKASYKKTIKALLGKDLYESPLTKVTEATLDAKVKAAPQASGATALRSLSSVWNWLSRHPSYRGRMPANPVKEYATYHEGLHVPAPRDRRVNVKDLPDFLAEVEKRPAVAKEALLWLCLTGNRVGELEGLEWQHMDFRANEYVIPDPKNRRPARLPIPSTLVAPLRRRRKASGRVFPVKVRGHLKTVCEAVGFTVSPHDLRRTHAGICAAVLPETSAKRLQHRVLTDVFHQYVGTSADLHDELAKVEREFYRLAGKPLDNVQHLEVVK